MKKKVQKWLLPTMTIFVFLILGLQFDGSISRLLERRRDYISNVQMGGDRYSFSFGSLKYYLRSITEPFAFVNICGNVGVFAVFAFLSCLSCSKKNVRCGVLYSLSIGICIEVFQYMTWFGIFDVADIGLRFVGTLIGASLYYLYRLGCQKVVDLHDKRMNE